MARVDKYYSTTTPLYGHMNDKIVELGYKGSHNQFRIICKAKSRAEANRIAELYGLYKNTFEADYTSETGNELEVEIADKYGMIIAIDGTRGGNYVDIKVLL